jgi:hypothetical protein
MKWIFIYLIILPAALAEYRVYQYLLLNKVIHDDLPKKSIINSTLNPRSYIAYNGGSRQISIDLLRTWVCPGNTAGKSICKSPYEKITKAVLP